MKTSLHRSGRYRHAFVDPDNPWLPAGQDRAWLKWTEPEESADGVKHIFEIVVPTDELSPPEMEPPDADKAKITLVPPAWGNEVVVFSLLTTSACLDATPISPEGARVSDTLVLWPLPNGHRLRIVVSYQDFEPGLRRLVADGHKIAARETAHIARPIPGHPRVCLWDDGGSGVPRIYDLDDRPS